MTETTDIQSIFDIEIKTPEGRTTNLEEYRGKVLLIVNTATECGLAGQFRSLESLYQRYKDKGFVVLGFPSNQFRNQEPVENSKMEEVCFTEYGVTFPLFEKIDVNGEDSHPIYKFLKSELTGTFGKKIKWNFTKFLINKEGKPIKRFSPITHPDRIRPYIDKLIA